MLGFWLSLCDSGEINERGLVMPGSYEGATIIAHFKSPSNCYRASNSEKLFVTWIIES